MKSKKVFKFNTVDFLICIIALLTVVFGVLSLYNNRFSSDFNSKTKEEIEIVIESENINEFLIDNIKVGDPVLSADNGNIFGTVKSVSVSDAVIAFENGEIRTIPDMKKLTVSILCNSELAGSYYLVGNEKIIIGESYNLISPNINISGKCVSLNSAQ